MSRIFENRCHYAEKLAREMIRQYITHTDLLRSRPGKVYWYATHPWNPTMESIPKAKREMPVLGKGEVVLGVSVSKSVRVSWHLNPMGCLVSEHRKPFDQVDTVARAVFVAFNCSWTLHRKSSAMFLKSIHQMQHLYPPALNGLRCIQQYVCDWRCGRIKGWCLSGTDGRWSMQVVLVSAIIGRSYSYISQNELHEFKVRLTAVDHFQPAYYRSHLNNTTD